MYVLETAAITNIFISIIFKVSFPGSGNSWLRMLIQGVSGVFIASIYPVGDDNLFHSKGKAIVKTFLTFQNIFRCFKTNKIYCIIKRN